MEFHHSWSLLQISCNTHLCPVSVTTPRCLRWSSASREQCNSMLLSPLEPHRLCHTQTGFQLSAHCQLSALRTCTIPPRLTLQYFLDSPETRAALLRALLSLDIGQTFFPLSCLNCDWDKNLLPSGSEVAWSELTILEMPSEKLDFQNNLLLFQFQYWVHLLQSPQILGGHIANVNLEQLYISSKQKSYWLQNPVRYVAIWGGAN